MNQQTSSPEKIARNPVRGFIYGTAWLIIAISIGAVLISFIATDASVSDTNGQRTAGFVVTIPFIALAASIFCFVRGGLAIAPYKAYMHSTTPSQRKRLQKDAWKNQGPPIGLTTFFAVVSYLGLLTLLVVLGVNYTSISASVSGLGSFLSVLLLVGLLSAALTELLARITRARL